MDAWIAPALNASKMDAVWMVPVGSAQTASKQSVLASSGFPTLFGCLVRRWHFRLFSVLIPRRRKAEAGELPCWNRPCVAPWSAVALHFAAPVLNGI